MITLPPESLVLIIVAAVVGSVPFYLAVKLLGGEVSFFKAILVYFGAGVLSGLISGVVPGIIGGVLAYICTLAVLRYATGLSWFRCVLVGIVQAIVVFGLVFLLGGLVGIALL